MSEAAAQGLSPWMDRRVLVTGAGGFIGGHLARRLVALGADVRAADVKPLGRWYQLSDDAENVVGDLRDGGTAAGAVADVDDVVHLAADMGGIGYISQHKWDCMLSVLLDSTVLRAAVEAEVERFLFASSACVYPQGKQGNGSRPLKESDAYPADPEGGYGWAKLFSERLCGHADAETAVAARVARLHNVYGPHGAYRDGREKAPAALCRKVVEFQLGRSDAVEIWGDGRQERSFLYVDDAVEGLIRLLESDVSSPLNVGSEEQVTINGLVDLIEEIAGTNAPRRFDPAGPTGVASRSSDNGRVRAELGWEPAVDLRTGMQRLYNWIADQLR